MGQTNIQLIRSRKCKLSDEASQMFDIPVDIYVYLEVATKDVDELCKEIVKCGTVNKVLSGLKEEEYLMIFVPFKDHR